MLSRIWFLPALSMLVMLTACRVEKTRNAAIKEVELNTSALCEECVEVMREALAYVRGIQSFELDIQNHTLIIQYLPGKTHPEKIISQILQQGFDINSEAGDRKRKERLPSCCR